MEIKALHDEIHDKHGEIIGTIDSQIQALTAQEADDVLKGELQRMTKERDETRSQLSQEKRRYQNTWTELQEDLVNVQRQVTRPDAEPSVTLKYIITATVTMIITNLWVRQLQHLVGVKVKLLLRVQCN